MTGSEMAALIISIAALAVGVAALPKSSLRVPLAVLCALCVLVAGAIIFWPIGVSGSLSGANDSGGSTASDGPVMVSAVPAGSRNVSVTVELDSRASQDHVYWFVLEVHDVNGHSEWYPRREVDGSGSFSVDIPGNADLSRWRTGAVYEVSTQDSEHFHSIRPDPNGSSDVLLDAPCCIVSGEIDLPF